MTARIPTPTPTPWLHREQPRAWIELIGVLIAGASVVWKASSDPAGIGILYLAILSLSIVVVLGIFRIKIAAKKDRESGDRLDPQHLLAPLRVLHALVAQKKGITNDPVGRKRFRVTLHATLDASNEHQQVVEYVGGEGRKTKDVVGRKWPNACGLVGMATRGKAMKHMELGAHVDTPEKYLAELVSLYGYTVEQARLLQPDRYDALAIPIQSEDQVIGVMYADSSDRNFFDDETVDLCILISSAITQHVEKIYGR